MRNVLRDFLPKFSRQRAKIAHAPGVALLVLLVATMSTGLALAEQLPEMPKGPAPAVNAEQVQEGNASFKALADGAQDEAVPRPNHPPIDQIPPMPMPYPDLNVPALTGPEAPGSGVIYNPATGETVILSPAATQDSTTGPQQGNSYDGADGGSPTGEMFPASMTAAMTHISNTADVPWRMNAKLVIRLGTNYAVCSGSMIDASTVLTAGHCVYNRDASFGTVGWVDDIWVYPGWDGAVDQWSPPPSTINPYGYGRSTYFGSWSGWTTSGDWNNDIGVVRIDRPVGVLTGWFGWAYGGDCATRLAQTWNNASYPAEGCGQTGLHNGLDMYYWYGQFNACPDWNRLRLYTSGGCFNAIWGGMSGSGVYYIDTSGRYIHAVTSTSNRSTLADYTRQWDSWTNWVNGTFIPGSRGSTFDLAPLHTVAAPATINAGSTTTTFSHLATNATNGASSTSGPWYFKSYLSTNDYISASDTLLGSWSYPRTFGAMNSVTVYASATIPKNTPEGDYWLGVVYAADTDATSTNNFTKGWDAAKIHVHALPDLVIQSVTTTPASPLVNQAMNVTVTVRNDGGAAAGNFWVDIYKDRASAPSPGQYGETWCGINSLAPGATATCTRTVSYDVGGPHNLWALADSGQFVTESFENNNASGPYVITAVNLTPTLGSLTPSLVTTLAGSPQTFSAIYSDGNGHMDLRYSYMLVNSALSGPNGIYALYEHATNLLWLFNDAASGLVGSCTPGVAGTLANSQGTINCGATTVVGSGNDLTINWNITPTAAFASATPKNFYTYCRDMSGAPVGWADKGNWTIKTTNVAPTLGTLTSVPLVSTAGTPQTVSAVYSDADGYGNLKLMRLLVQTTVSGVNSINLYYDRISNTLALYNNAGTNIVGTCTPGVAGTLANSQGTLNCAATTVVGSGNNLTINWNITPTLAFASTTPKNFYMKAEDMASASVGWSDKGDWTIKTTNVAPTLGPLTPVPLVSTAGTPQTVSAVYGDPDGYGNLKLMRLLVQTTVSGVNSINLYYDRSNNTLALYNDAGTNIVGTCTPGVAGTLANSQGTLNCAATTVVGSGNNLTINWNITPTAAFASATPKNFYTKAHDMASASVGWSDKGDWTIKTTNAAPTLGTLTPVPLVSTAGTPQTLSAVYGDPDGYGNLKLVRLLVQTTVSGANSINLYYDRISNTFALYNDAGTNIVGTCTPGMAGTLANSQVSLNCAATTVVGSGNDLTINWNITPSTAFASTTPKNIYTKAHDMASASVGWSDKGDWTIKTTNAAPTLGTLTPVPLVSTAGTPQTVSAVYGDPDGYGNLKLMRLLVQTTVSGVNSINLYYDRISNTLALYNNAGTSIVGTCTPGMAGTLANSQGSLNCATTTVVGSGNNLTINWNITPMMAFASTTPKNIYMKAEDMASVAVGWTDKGDWTIQ